MDYSKKNMYTMTDYELSEEVRRRCGYYVPGPRFDLLDLTGRRGWGEWRNACYNALFTAPLDISSDKKKKPWEI